MGYLANKNSNPRCLALRRLKAIYLVFTRFYAKVIFKLLGTPATTTTSTSLFGQSRSIFGTGTSTNNLFGGSTPATSFGQPQQQQSSLFSTGGFGGLIVSFFRPFNLATVVNGTTVKFDPVKGSDTMMKNNETKTISTKHMCITVMKPYETKSVEVSELLILKNPCRS